MIFYWILGFFILILIVIIIWGFSVPKAKNIERQVEEETGPPTKWTKGLPVEGDRGTCSLYTFQGKMSGVYASPAVPKLDKLDNLTPNSTFSCVDVDGIVAQKISRTCKGENNTFCRREDGSLVSPGVEETLYQECQTDPCAGTLSLITLKHPSQNREPDCDQKPYSSVCLSVQGDSVILKSCNIGDLSQLFRITRKYSEGEPGTRGPLTQILHRQTGKCLTASLDSNGKPSLIKLGECGFVWGAIPPFLSVNGDTIRETNVPCSSATQTNCVTLSPAQIAYLSNLSIPDSLDGEELRKILKDNSVQSMTPGPGNSVILTPFSFDFRTGRDKNAQFIDYASYNSVNSSCYSKSF